MTRLLLAHSSSRSIALYNKTEELSQQLSGANEPGRKMCVVRHVK